MLDDEAIRDARRHGHVLRRSTCTTASGRSSTASSERWPADTMRKLAETMETGEAAFRQAIELGVRITYGTDSGVYPHELVAQAVRTCVRALRA